MRQSLHITLFVLLIFALQGCVGAAHKAAMESKSPEELKRFIDDNQRLRDDPEKSFMLKEVYQERDRLLWTAAVDSADPAQYIVYINDRTNPLRRVPGAVKASSHPLKRGLLGPRVEPSCWDIRGCVTVIFHTQQIEGEFMRTPVVVLFVSATMLSACASVSSLKRGCDAGDMYACNKLGVALYGGPYATKNQDQASDLFIKACNGGETYACYNYGKHLEKDGAGEARLKEAYKAYAKACVEKATYSTEHTLKTNACAGTDRLSRYAPPPPPPSCDELSSRMRRNCLMECAGNTSCVTTCIINSDTPAGCE